VKDEAIVDVVRNSAVMNDQWFREFEHTGDLGIEVSAQSRRELFGRAAIAMAAVMVDTVSVVKRENREIRITASSDNDLMHDALSRLLDISSSRASSGRKLRWKKNLRG
jgi:SHS2 domain-containing protein